MNFPPKIFVVWIYTFFTFVRSHPLSLAAKPLRARRRGVLRCLLHAVDGHISGQLVGLPFFHRGGLTQRYSPGPACATGF